MSLKYFVRNIDEKNFNKIVDIVKNQNCVSFVGAGLSISKGYRSWQEVILGTQKKQKLVIHGLVQAVGKRLKDYSKSQRKDLYEIAQDCKAFAQELYEQFIIKEFDRKNYKRNWDQTHYYVWKIPFLSILTTNFDPCLYDAGFEVLGKDPTVFTTGGFGIPLKKGNLYHIHGITIKTNPPINNIKTIVLSKSEYNQAYSKNGSLYRFLTHVMQNHHLLFIGYSFKDRFFETLIDEIINILDEERRVAEEIHKIEFRLRDHYLMIRENEITSQREKMLKKYNIHIIKFTGVREDYSSLLNLLIELYENVTDTKLPEPLIQKLF